MWRLVAGKPANGPVRGLAIGWLIGTQVDAKLRGALPGFAIVATELAPLSVSASDIAAARRLAAVGSDVGTLLFAWSAGCQSLRAALLANLCLPLLGVAVFDGTSGQVPPLGWQIDVWRKLADAARNGGPPFVATATQMTYTEAIPLGSKGRGAATSHVLSAALGAPLTLGAPIVERNLYAELYPSDDGPTKRSHDAHLAQVNEAAPRLLADWFGAFGPPRAPDTLPAPPVPTPPESSPEVPPWRDPGLSFGARCVEWSLAEMRANVREAPPGSNDSPRIRDYFSLDYRRRVTGERLRLTRTAWCAVAACYAHYECALPGDSYPTPRVSGVELIDDAKANGTFVAPGTRPDTGWLAIFLRPGEPWYRHVTRVCDVDADAQTFRTVAGNENNGWNFGGPFAFNDPNLVGLIRV